MNIGKVLWIVILLALVLLLAGAAFSAPAWDPGRRELESRTPPQIPHSTEGRRDCLSCHRDGLRPPITPHPERVNCVQCHVPSQQ